MAKGDRYERQKDSKVCVMQIAKTVLEVIQKIEKDLEKNILESRVR